MKVKQIVNSILYSNTWVLSDEKMNTCWLVDCGDVDLIQSDFTQNTLLKGVFLTHVHYDHIYGLNDILKKYPDCLIYTNHYGFKALLSDKLNLSRYHGQTFIFKYPQNIRLLGEGQLINLSDECSMYAFMTPGHSPSCISYQCGNYLFTGDSYIPHVQPVTNLPGGNSTLYYESLSKIRQRITPSLELCAGHGTCFIGLEMLDEFLK